ncbi:hypothetical protein AQJ43_36890 [Streptomyces avermitilis]|uniref:Uncharacterized protein n=2 Tax=Streptomyces avermitilis TaxID=33903 RepID=A0A143SZB5_STRAW|nr:hypothetical protein [Streptomyces avermitilis]KUN47886.1 hypothetical protein AQJ43_36890 [Streptomyces avermitilis]BAU77458.1 hypothetical protein SAVERM_2p014 [Streptomyces avermitilis MA-4680 = NBRC 14893]BBJ56329.1 hypothetical protein SAVMC3_89580 [Streptomyces avermitilis]GDY70128.1 hypothetical protein SAV14893_095210 [Streptomyces avermitilis]GDY80420.1 hypothetical protein SAV31267_099050 [Streptomyces avermitilis]
MNTYLQHALDLVIEGFLTQLPAQLITAAVAAAAATWMRTRKKNRARAVGTPADPGADTSPQLLQATARECIHADRDASPSLGKH